MPISRENYVFFWRITSQYGWASQWYYSPFKARIQFEVDSRIIDSETDYEFPTCEHWMMASKALLFDDKEVFQRVIDSDATDMTAVKRLGREVRGFDEKVWKAAREVIVYQGNLEKFRQNEELKKELLETGEKIIVEASPRDRIWGVGYGEKRALEVKGNWGLNLLGKALEEVRSTLRKEMSI